MATNPQPAAEAAAALDQIEASDGRGQELAAFGATLIERCLKAADVKRLQIDHAGRGTGMRITSPDDADFLIVAMPLEFKVKRRADASGATDEAA